MPAAFQGDIRRLSMIAHYYKSATAGSLMTTAAKQIIAYAQRLTFHQHGNINLTTQADTQAGKQRHHAWLPLYAYHSCRYHLETVPANRMPFQLLSMAFHRTNVADAAYDIIISKELASNTISSGDDYT